MGSSGPAHDIASSARPTRRIRRRTPRPKAPRTVLASPGFATRRWYLPGSERPDLNAWADFFPSHQRYILAVMTTLPARRRHLANSPFQPDPEPVIEQFECGDLVNHDSYGMGRVIGAEAAAVTVDFRTQTVRITSPFHKLAIL